ncbi:hypothetical protein [Dendrosporobacter sp. 1207_IL3150]|uniref:hypothetical protein n=1 Tax=Dendrosporobacter sp. 1207_IL3150 TaxID=3084054 RepID=UPI002FD920FA
MKNRYCDKQLRGIAGECQEFEHIISAMGYGYSLLNVSPSEFVRRCTDCVHWLGGSCEIFKHEITQ